MNTKTNILCVAINLLSLAQVIGSLLLSTEDAIQVSIFCMGSMLILGVVFIREFFRAVRQRQDEEETTKP